MLRLGLRIVTHVTQTARLVRDIWQSVSDPWELEERKWENIV